MPSISPALSEMNDSEIASDAPLTEALFTKMGANINALIRSFMPVGSVIHSMLTEAEFQSEIGSSTYWVLSDGRDVSGSAYSVLTGATTVPDMRGRFLRGKNNGTSTTDGDASGERDLGNFQGSKLANHTHITSITAFNFRSAYLNVAITGSGNVTAFHALHAEPAGTSGVSAPNIPSPSIGDTPTPVPVADPTPSSGTTTNSDETAPKNICVNIFIRIN